MTPGPHDPWLFFLIAGLCVVLSGIAKGGFGGGVGVIATPLLSLVVSPLVAAGILLPLLCACDLFAVWHYRRTFDRGNLVQLVPGGLVGILIGAGLLWHLKGETAAAERALRILIGVIAILFVIWQAGRAWFLKHLPPARPGTVFGAAMGVTAGFTSTLAHAGGPPVTIHLLPQRLPRQIFVGTTVWFFTIANYVKLAPYAALGMLDLANLRISAMLLPLVPVGVYAGIWCNRRINDKWFNIVVYTLLLLVGIQLLSGYDPLSLLARITSLR